MYDELKDAPVLIMASTETKPTVAGGKPKPQRGTCILEEDTSKVYIYNSKTDAWREL